MPGNPMSAKQKLFIILILLLAVSLSCCAKKADTPSFESNSIESYRGIPGVTGEEIKAIEAFKSAGRSFSLGTRFSSDAYALSDGVYSGYFSAFCGLLSDLFGAPFIQEFYPHDSLYGALDSGTIDFAGDLAAAPENKEVYFVSLPIAERPLGIIVLNKTINIQTAMDLDGLKLGFYGNVITADSIKKVYSSLVFEALYFDNDLAASEALSKGIIDAFICDSCLSHSSEEYDFFRYSGILPLVYTPVFLSAKKTELEPVISVLNKYIASGGIDKLQELYRECSREYSRYEFNYHLTDNERAYLAANGSGSPGLPIALEGDNYPICFFNDKENTFQGIAPDLLSELSALTGLKFNIITEKNTPWGTILGKLNTGEAVLVSELLYTEGRKGKYLWSEPVSNFHYAFLSKTDYPHREIYQVARTRVGINRNSAYEDLYKLWFHDNSNVIYYDTLEEIVAALDKGDIDLMFSSERSILYLANYLEKTGYKVNIFFDSPLEESRFGFNRDQELLCSIFCKAQQYFNNEKIIVGWTNRIFDYSKRLAQDKLFNYLLFASSLSLLLLILAVMLIINIKTRASYKQKMLMLSTIYKALPDLVYSKDANGRYTSCNNSFEDFVQLKEPDIVGKLPFDVYKSEKTAKIYYERDKWVLENNKTLKTEKWAMFPDNTSHLMETLNAPLVEDNKVVGILGIARDITDHKNAEAAANEASKAKSDFLAKMSHEIRTPMNAIIGMTELALRSKDLREAQKQILTVKQAGSHLLSIINDILDFSKIERGKLEIIRNEYMFSNLINNVISIIRMRLIDSGIRFVVNIDSNIPNLLFGDETRIRQVILNILSNAVKYTEKGFISLVVNREIINEEKVNLIIEVLDSGKGIRKEDIKNLFMEYSQFDMGHKSIEGVGLGLAITKNILKQMEGEIEVSSEYGKGSSFVATIPQKILSGEPMAFIVNPDKKKTLVYERREMYAHSIISAFDNLNVEYSIVKNDDELKKELEENEYNYVFISNNLFEINDEIISCYSKKIKIVVMTEFGEAISNRKLNILALPVYSISIANIFNGITNGFSYGESNEQILKFSAPKANILIVDDINTNLKVAEGLISPYKMKVDLCSSGKSAIEAVSRKQYDIIFMDHKMPEMDGIIATNIIRKINTNNNYFINVPIVALTANAVLGTKEMFLENGFSDFLSKPIDTNELDTILEKWIPEEKKVRQTEEKSELYTRNIEDFKHDISIDGIDINTGIHFSGGTLELYLETLNIFNMDCSNKIDDICDAISIKDLNNYTIYIHAIKSALANIGANELSLTAKRLEEAGESGDYDYIRSENSNFVVALEKLLDNIKRTLSMYKKIQPKEIMNMETFGLELLKLKEALDSMDAGTVNMTIDDLKRKSNIEKINISLNNIADKILIGDYEDASDSVHKLYQEVSKNV